jgi:D-alanine-D-alanine ligase
VNAKQKVRVGLLFGGRSPEHEVSITTAASIAKEADPERIEIVPIYITREGHWQQLHASEPLALLAGHVVTDKEIGELPRREVLLNGAIPASLVPITSSENAPEPIDVLFPALHGQGGEEGSIQGLARLADVPCVGAGILGSALGMDKISMKQIAQAHKVPIPRFVAFTRLYWERDSGSIREAIQNQLEPPVFVKPSNAGSSVGITKVSDLEALDAAVRAAAVYDYRILVEQGINARELEVAVLGNDMPKASVVGEVVPGREFYDYRDKYVDEGSQQVIPADVPDEVSEEVRRIAIRMFQALDLSGMARADFLLDRRDGRLYFNEINTIPGFTPISMYPMLWEASGISYRELITKLVELALERHAATRVETRRPRVEGGG